jgi:hypothetical protein
LGLFAVSYLNFDSNPEIQPFTFELPESEAKKVREAFHLNCLYLYQCPQETTQQCLPQSPAKNINSTQSGSFPQTAL